MAVTKTKPPHPAAAHDPHPRYWLRRLVVLGLVGTAVFVLIFGVFYAFASIPKPEDVAAARSSVVEDVKGRFVGRLHGSEDRAFVPLSQVPEVARNAVIAAEDRNFYRHKGVSPFGVFRAAVSNLLAGKIKQGGSTITQQYVKNAFVGRKRTVSRKFREAVVAVKLERKWSKNEILEAYLNTIYFGRGAYGIDAAARAYFGIPAARLSLPQAALLAGVIRAPEKLDPAKRPEAAERVRRTVLAAMRKERMITAEEYDEARENEPKTISRAMGVTGRGPYFLEAVRRDLVKRFGEDEVYRGGLRVRTTMDVDMQKAAEEAVAGVLDRDTDPEAALVSIEPRTGSVRAYVGGRDYSARQFDLAGQAKRQPGSSFKPFVLAAHIDGGGSLGATYRAPGTITLQTGGKPWTVSNYDKKDYGTLSLADATANSVNTVYAQLILDVGPKRVVGMAETLGIRSELDAVPALALGTEEVSPLELASAYAVLADDGKRVRPHLLMRVTNRAGTELYRFSERAERAVDPNVARTVTAALQRVVQSGTGRSADLGRPAAGKTGTTENHRDAWFAGYTPDLATVVWMGYPDGTRTMERVRGTRVVGGNFPARIWKAFMTKALAGVEPAPFPAASPVAPTGSPQPIPTGSQSAPAPPGTAVPTTPGTSSPPPPPPTSTPTQTPTPTPSQTKNKSSPTPSPSPSGGQAAA